MKWARCLPMPSGLGPQTAARRGGGSDAGLGDGLVWSGQAGRAGTEPGRAGCVSREAALGMMKKANQVCSCSPRYTLLQH